MIKVMPRERVAIIQSLRGGVVPAVGLQHIQVGRKSEVAALLTDLQNVEDGAAAVRFIVGRYGTGKTFFLNLIRNVALQRKFLVVQGDISPDQRLHGTGGVARAFYAELVKNMATRSKPEGGALSSVVERWVGDIDHDVKGQGGNDEDVKNQITQRLRPLQELVSGFDFAIVMSKYFEGHLTHNEDLQSQALRWFRGEFSTKTEAKNALGVRTIIDDESYYDYLKLWAAFARLAGYKGLLVNIDELVVLTHKLTNTIARNNNLEAILRIFNDCLQGRASGICFIFAGTEECLEDRHRGLYSYEALEQRLAPNRFASDTRTDFSTPVIKLTNLTPEDCFVLLCNIRNVFTSNTPQRELVSDEGITAFLANCSQKMGAAYFQNARSTVRDFVNLLSVMEQNPQTSWVELVGNYIPTEGEVTATENANKDDDLAGFKL